MFIPLGDDNRFRIRTPFVVFVLIALNFVGWFLQLEGGDRFTMAYATIPFEITHGQDIIGTQVLVADGMRIPIRHTEGPTPIYLTLITAMFLHGSWMHILGNMLYLWIFGDQIEDELGHIRFLIFYLVCGIVAGYAQIVMEPDSVIPCLGASGAIAGVLGAYLIRHPNNRVQVLVFRDIVSLPAVVVLGFWIVLQLIGQVGSVAGQGSGVAYMAHIGGFFAGLIMLLIITRGHVRADR